MKSVVFVGPVGIKPKTLAELIKFSVQEGSTGHLHVIWRQTDVSFLLTRVDYTTQQPLYAPTYKFIFFGTSQKHTDGCLMRCNVRWNVWSRTVREDKWLTWCFSTFSRWQSTFRKCLTSARTEQRTNFCCRDGVRCQSLAGQTDWSKTFKPCR